MKTLRQLAREFIRNNKVVNEDDLMELFKKAELEKEKIDKTDYSNYTKNVSLFYK